MLAHIQQLGGGLFNLKVSHVLVYWVKSHPTLQTCSLNVLRKTVYTIISGNRENKFWG